MWRRIFALIVVTAALGLGLLIESVLHDETASSAIAGMLGVFGIALLYPVKFGLKEPPRR